MPSILAHVLLPFLHIFSQVHVVIVLQYSLPSSFIGFFISSYSFCFLHLLSSPSNLLSISLFFFISLFPSVPGPTPHISPQCICSFPHFSFFALLGPLLSSSSSRLSFLCLSHKKVTSRSSSSHIFIPCFFTILYPPSFFSLLSFPCSQVHLSFSLFFYFPSLSFLYVI